MKPRCAWAVCRHRRLTLTGAVAILTANLVVTAGDRAGASDPAGSTIGVNALAMSSEPATYRLRLDGTASRAGGAPVTPGAAVQTSPSGHYRFEFGASGVAVIDAQTGKRRALPRSGYPGSAFWGPGGTLAYADRKAGLTRVVIFDPVSGRRRVAASHVCGDAFHVDPWSPDGRSLAIAVSPVGGGCNGQGGSQAAVWDGSVLRRVAPLGSVPITWSRDGTRLLVASGRDSRSLLVDPRTGTRREVLPSIGLGYGTWSPGRRAFATLGLDRARRAQVVALIDGRLRRVIRSVLFGTQFAWSPRAQLLAVADGKAVRVIDAGSGKDVAVVPVHTPYGLVAQSVAWTRDGRSLTLVASPHPGHD